MLARLNDQNVSDMERLAKQHNLRDYFMLGLIGKRGLRIGTVVGEHSKHHRRNKKGELVETLVDLPGIKKEDVRPDALVVHEKGGRQRIVALPGAFQREIFEFASHFRQGERIIAISEQAARLIVPKYAKLAGVEGHVRPHMWRHYFGTKKARETGRDAWKVKSLMGHKDIRSTARYVDDLSLEEEKELLK